MAEAIADGGAFVAHGFGRSVINAWKRHLSLSAIRGRLPDLSPWASPAREKTDAYD